MQDSASVIPFPMPEKRGEHGRRSASSDAETSSDLLDLAATLTKTSRLIVRSMRAGDPSSAGELLLSLRSRTDSLLTGLAKTMETRRRQPELDLLLSQLDTADRDRELGRAEALINSIYVLCDAARSANPK